METLIKTMCHECILHSFKHFHWHFYVIEAETAKWTNCKFLHIWVCTWIWIANILMQFESIPEAFREYLINNWATERSNQCTVVTQSEQSNSRRRVCHFYVSQLASALQQLLYVWKIIWSVFISVVITSSLFFLIPNSVYYTNSVYMPCHTHISILTDHRWFITRL